MQIGTTLEVARGKKRHFTVGERKSQMQPIRVESLPGSKLQQTQYLLEVSLFYLANGQYATAGRMARGALQIELRQWFAAECITMTDAIQSLRINRQITPNTSIKLLKLVKRRHQFTITEFEDCLDAIRDMAGLPKIVKERVPIEAAQSFYNDERLDYIECELLENLKSRSLMALHDSFGRVFPRKQFPSNPQIAMQKLRGRCVISREVLICLTQLLNSRCVSRVRFVAMSAAVNSLNRLAEGGAA